jgi:hypothetical protein
MKLQLINIDHPNRSILMLSDYTMTEVDQLCEVCRDSHLAMPGLLRHGMKCSLRSPCFRRPSVVGRSSLSTGAARARESSDNQPLRWTGRRRIECKVSHRWGTDLHG